ncbi:hypothetical protein J6590_107654, partial [Homalodisca vitripennis]
MPRSTKLTKKKHFRGNQYARISSGNVNSSAAVSELRESDVLEVPRPTPFSASRRKIST